MGITVTITAARNQSRCNVNASGSVQYVITDADRNTFGIPDNALKQAIAKYWGKSPTDAYVRSPTPWGDLYTVYAQYGWNQVQTVLSVTDAKVLSITSNPEIINTVKLKNDSSTKGTFTAAIATSVMNTAETNWSETSTIDVTQTIDYSVGVEGIGDIGGSTSFSFSQAFGMGGSQTQTVSVGSTQGVSVDLDPHSSVAAQLTASRGAMKVRVTYNAYLTGDVAANYNPTFKDHHFFALDIAEVMQAGGITNSQVITEDIEIGFYSNATVNLSDPNMKMNRVRAAS